MLYNSPKTVLESISKLIKADRTKYEEEKQVLEGKLQLEAMAKLQMEYIVPEEIEKESRAHFMGAAAAAHKSGKKSFSFAGKTYPVQIQRHVAKQVNEKLVGNQHKIDANKNGKVDAHDFKLLRKEEAEQVDELKKSTLGSYVKKASVDMANRSSDATAKRTLAGADYAHNISRGMAAKTADAHMKKDREAAQPDVKKAVQRFRGIEKAVGRLAKEEVEVEGVQIDEAKKPVRKMKEGLWDTIKSAMTGANPYGYGQKTGTSVYNPSTGRYEEKTPSVKEGILDTIKQAFSSNTSGSNISTVSDKNYKSDVDYSKQYRTKSAGSGWNNVRPSAPNLSGTGMKSYNTSTGRYEEKDTPGQHMCALHVKHSTLGEGTTLFSQHAEPSEDGTIEWYDVMFEHGIEKQVPTTDLEILVQESHGNHTKGKK